MNKTIYLTSALVVATAAASAQMPADMAMPKMASAPGAGASTMSDGVVQNVDKPRAMLTLKHGDILNMGMPPMTMGFKVADRSMLDAVKPGDSVRFHLENVGGTPTVTRLEAARQKAKGPGGR